MKLASYFLCFIVFWGGTSSLWGLGRSYSNIDYLRTLNRTASLATVDSVFFNPSGTTRIVDGMYFYLGLPIPISFGDASHLGLIDPSFAFIKKSMGRSIFFTFAPLPSNRVVLDKVRSKDADILASYAVTESTYETAVGGAFSITDSFMLSISGKIFSSIDSYKAQFFRVAGVVPGVEGDRALETYFLSRFELGTRLHLGFSYHPVQWFSMSLNIDSVGLGASTYWCFNAPLAGAGVGGGAGTSKSQDEKRPQKNGISRIVSTSYPLRVDFGMRFFRDDVMTLQITAYGEFFTTKNRLGAPIAGGVGGVGPGGVGGVGPGGVGGADDDFKKIFTDSIGLDGMSYGGGLGVDFNLSRSVIWGLGMYFDNRVQRHTKYESLSDAVLENKFMGLSFATGLAISISDGFELSLSINYPIYFKIGSGGFEIFNFQESYTSAVPPPPAGNNTVNVGDFLCAIGFHWKLMGL